MIGTRLGAYLLRQQIGVGGMGTVYAADHEVLRRPAAVKVLLPEFAIKPAMQQRFLTEARAAAAIRHHGVVQIYDVGFTADGTTYLAMELLDGETLGQRMARGPLDRGVVLAIARQIADALGAAHKTGVVHRDLKPDNVFIVVDPDARDQPPIKLLDFGVAKILAPSDDPQVTSAGAIIGTPSYMSPEQCRAVAVDHRSDLYGLGCILFALVAGTPPFRGEGMGDIITAHVHVAPPRLADAAPDVGPGLAALVAGLLAKAPADRPQSAAAVSAALKQLEAEARRPARPHASAPPPRPTEPRARVVFEQLAATAPSPLDEPGDVTLPTTRFDVSDDDPTKQTRAVVQLAALADARFGHEVAVHDQVTSPRPRLTPAQLRSPPRPLASAPAAAVIPPAPGPPPSPTTLAGSSLDLDVPPPVARSPRHWRIFGIAVLLSAVGVGALLAAGGDDRDRLPVAAAALDATTPSASADAALALVPLDAAIVLAQLAAEDAGLAIAPLPGAESGAPFDAARSAIEMEEDRVAVTIATEPTGASLYLDGIKVGHTPYDGDIGAGAGSLRVTVRLDGYASMTRTMPGDRAVAQSFTMVRGGERPDQAPTADGPVIATGGATAKVRSPPAYATELELRQQAYELDPRPQQLLGLGDAAVGAGQQSVAIIYYGMVIKRLPGTAQAATAEKRLAAIKQALERQRRAAADRALAPP